MTNRKVKQNLKKSKHFGFSVAEAMVTLLIVSRALAAAAPIITKRNNSNGNYRTEIRILNERITELDRIISELREKIDNLEIPENTIAFFNMSSCPPGWQDLTTVNANAANRFIRIANGSGRAIGSTEDDMIQEHSHYLSSYSAAIGATGWGFVAQYGSSELGGRTHGVVDKDGTETRPKNVAYLACIKTKD